jgi:hypothetical protein
MMHTLVVIKKIRERETATIDINIGGSRNLNNFIIFTTKISAGIKITMIIDTKTDDIIITSSGVN